MSDFTKRTQMLLGEEAIQKLKKAHVLVIGLGGVGGFCVEALARAGVGAITVVDHDMLTESNRNRQLFALRSTVGRNKVDVAKERIEDINDACTVIALPLFYDEVTAKEIWKGSYDYVMDAIDTVTAKLHLIGQAHRRNVPILSAMGTGNKLNPHQFKIEDISKTTVCPLARVMRRELKKREIYHHMVLYSEEIPHINKQEDIANENKRSVPPGSVSWVPSCAGLMMAGYAIQQIIDPLKKEK